MQPKPDPFQVGPLRQALREMFNAQLQSSQVMLAGYVAAFPRDPLGYSLSAAVPFYHFVGNRLRPHGGTSIQEMILGKGIGVPADIRHVNTALAHARRLATVELDADPRDQNALLALSIAEGVERDLLVLVDRRWRASLQHAQSASLHSSRLLAVNPLAYDAYYVIGLSEYVVSQIPSWLRPFTRIPGVVGEKSRAIQFLEAAAGSGCYLQDFARQILVTIFLEERRLEDAVHWLEGLARDFAGNAAYRAELARLSTNCGATPAVSR